ncbi:unnamed protein product, partial [Prorocentrum cordatum]
EEQAQEGRGLPARAQSHGPFGRAPAPTHPPASPLLFGGGRARRCSALRGPPARRRSARFSAQQLLLSSPPRRRRRRRRRRRKRVRSGTLLAAWPGRGEAGPRSEEGEARRGRAARRARRAGRTAAGRPQAGLRLSRSRRGLRLNHAVAAPQLGEEPLCGELDASALSCGAPRGGELRRDGARTFKVIFSTQGRSGTASETHSAAEHCLHSDAEIAVASVSAPAVPPGIWQPKGFAPEAPAMQLDTLFTALGVVAPAVEVAVPEEMSKHTATPEAAGSLSGGAEDRAKPALEPVVDGLPLDRCRKLL